MRIAITGASGFIGGHLAAALAAEGHELVLISRREPLGVGGSGARWVQADLSDAGVLAEALAGCDGVAHTAGINRELGRQTYDAVHVRGTENVVEAARRAGVRKVVLTSFLRARPECGSAYHESKWQAEEIVRGSGLDYTIVKSGMVFGRGDHMLDHMSRALLTAPFFATVGWREKPIRPLAMADMVRILRAALVEGRLARATVAVTGAEELYLSEAARRMARVLGRRVLVFPAPVLAHRAMAVVLEGLMKVPLASRAQVRILEEGVTEPAMPCEELPADLQPRLGFSADLIRAGLPPLEPFRLRDLRCCSA